MTHRTPPPDLIPPRHPPSNGACTTAAIAHTCKCLMPASPWLYTVQVLKGRRQKWERRQGGNHEHCAVFCVLSACITNVGRARRRHLYNAPSLCP